MLCVQCVRIFVHNCMCICAHYDSVVAFVPRVYVHCVSACVYLHIVRVRVCVWECGACVLFVRVHVRVCGRACVWFVSAIALTDRIHTCAPFKKCCWACVDSVVVSLPCACSCEAPHTQQTRIHSAETVSQQSRSAHLMSCGLLNVGSMRGEEPFSGAYE